MLVSLAMIGKNSWKFGSIFKESHIPHPVLSCYLLAQHFGIDIASHKDEMRFPILTDKQNLSRLLIDDHHTNSHIVHRETVLLALRTVRHNSLTL